MPERLREAYEPHGMNVGMNFGRAAGGVLPNISLHILPRWVATQIL